MIWGLLVKSKNYVVKTRILAFLLGSCVNLGNLKKKDYSTYTWSYLENLMSWYL